jgi:hypothetical protein
MSRFHIPVFHLGLGLLAGALLAYELLLLRLFKIAQGSEFTSIAISVALLGFGASGTLLAITRRKALRHARMIAVLSAPLAGAAMLGAFFVEQSVPFRPEFLVWGGRHVWHLLLWTLPLVVPFLIGAVGLGVVFVRWPRQTRSLYAANLLGSGLGAAGLYAMPHWLRPEDGILFVASLAALAGGLMGWRWRGRWALAMALLFVAGFAALNGRGMPEIRISDLRDLWQLRQLPDARTVATYHGPDGRVDLIESEHIHWAPGQSLANPLTVSPHLAICLDGSMVGTLGGKEFEWWRESFDQRGQPEREAFTQEQTDEWTRLSISLDAVPWRTVRDTYGVDSALILDLTSGLELQRLISGSPMGPGILLTQENATLANLILESIPLLGYRSDWQTRGSQDRLRDVRSFQSEALSALRNQGDVFDLIVAVSSGSHALQPDLLRTQRGICQILERLSERGAATLAVSVDHPQRSSLRLISLVTESLLRERGDAAQEQIWAVRGLTQIAVGFSASETLGWSEFQGDIGTRMRILRTEARFHSFDLVWAPDISPDEVNQFNILDEPIFYETVRRIFAGEAEEVYREYPFDLRPPTEWWPFFWQPFKPATVWGMLIGLRPGGLETIPEANAVLALIYQVRALALAALVLILLPLLWLRAAAARAPRLRAFAYFACIGVGYLMLEILMIVMARRYLGTPVLAATVTLAVFLIGSGLGSLMSRRVRWVFPGILLSTGIAVALLEMLIHHGAGFALPLRIALTSLLMLPMAWFLGMPFPRGLQALDRIAPPLVPWAWGVNGFASVLAAPLATLFALTGGYQIVLGVGLVAYVGASPIFPRRP